jgi:hypothetical protein
MSRDWLFTIARSGGASRGISETLGREGKGEESVVAIPRFLCGSSRLCRLRTVPFWPRWQALSCVLTACQVLWGPISRVAVVTTMSNRTSLLCVVLLVLEGE